MRVHAAAVLLASTVVPVLAHDGHGAPPPPPVKEVSRAGLERLDHGDQLKEILRRREPSIPFELKSDVDLLRLHAAGYFRSHGWTSFKGQGLAVATTSPTALRAETPGMLFYHSRAPSLDDTTLTDATADYPYELIGVGWFTEYLGRASSTEQPREPPPSGLPFVPPGLLPLGGWFRHTAGCHLPSGGFVPFRDNLPAPDLPRSVRTALGTSWCMDIGAHATWTDGACVLSRLAHSPRCPLKHEHPGDCQMSRSELRYFGGLLRPVPPGARVPLPTPSVRGSAEQNLQENTRQCERMGQEASTTNVPVMWHGAFWDTHVFFNEDGSVDVGIGDPARVPHGLDAPAESFVPESRVLHRVSRKAVTGSKPRAP